MTKHEFGKQFYEDPLYEYVRELALYRMADSDEYGPLDTSIAGEDRMWAIYSGKVEFPFTREEYDSREDIQSSIKAMGLDPDKFWELVRLIHHYADLVFNAKYYSLPSVRDQVVKFLDSLLDEQRQSVDEGISLVVEKEGKVVCRIKNRKVIEFMANGIFEHGKQHLDDVEFVGQPLSRDEADRETGGVSHRMCFESELYLYIIDRYRTDKDMPRRVKNSIGSRDKLLLVSRLMHMTGLTNIQAFNDSADRIKAIRKQYKDKEVNSVALGYLL